MSHRVTLFRFGILGVVSFVLITGCNPATPRVDRVPTYPVKGELLINGSPPVGAMVKFYASNHSGPLPTAIVREDGSFSASYYDVEDGAPAGEYKLLVVWMETPPGGGMAVDRLSGRFANPDQPVATIAVSSNENALPPISLQMPRSTK